jgi:hypothetical protein
MTLQDIFETNPKLLEEPEVKKLIEYVQTKHETTYKVYKKQQKTIDKILELCIYSNVILNNAKTPEQTVKAILELLGK